MPGCGRGSRRDRAAQLCLVCAFPKTAYQTALLSNPGGFLRTLSSKHIVVTPIAFPAGTIRCELESPAKVPVASLGCDPFHRKSQIPCVICLCRFRGRSSHFGCVVCERGGFCSVGGGRGGGPVVRLHRQPLQEADTPKAPRCTGLQWPYLLFGVFSHFKATMTADSSSTLLVGVTHTCHSWRDSDA